MSSFCKITIGKTPGATRANALYITRHGACESWETRNIPDEEHLGITREDQRASIADYLCEYAEQGRGERRDYRAVLSFDREVEKDKAMEMAEEWIESTRFGNNPALYAFHTNTDNPHIHVLVTARDVDGKKLDLSDRQYQSFDKAWAKIYDRDIERGVEKDHSQKCEETKSWKQEYGEQRQSGKDRKEIVWELGNIPRDRHTIAEYYQEKRSDDEQSLTDSLERESGLLRGVQEGNREPGPNHREPGPEDREPGGADSGIRSGNPGPGQSAPEVYGSLQDAEEWADVLRSASDPSQGAALPVAEAIRDGARRTEEEIARNVYGAEGALRSDCEAGNSQGRGECEGERAERGGNLQELCDRLTERFRESVARGVEGFRHAVQSFGQALKRIPEIREAAKEQFRDWREAAWERFTGRTHQQELEESGKSDSSDKPDRSLGWER